MISIVVLLGALTPFVSMNGMKTCGLWFPPRQLGLANGLISMGMALGFLIGSLVSATLLSPWLGGWRNVLSLYGSAGAMLSILWFFTRAAPSSHPFEASAPRISIRHAILHVAGLNNIWLLGLTIFGVGGCIQAILGYLPLYLRTIGWDALRADGTLSAFHTISMIFVLPIAFWSDRSGSRKHLLFFATLMITAGTALLSFASGGLIWIAVLMAGMTRDAFMALFMTMIVETDGVGPRYAGTAIGLVMALGGVGSFLAPPLGNSLAAYGPSVPFAFWAGLAVLGIGCLSLTKNSPQRTQSF
jgi:cyanate permease